MSDIKNTLINLTRNMTKTSGEFIKTTKLSVSLSSEQETLKNIYINIGKKVHEIYMYGGSLGKFFDEQYREIAVVEQRIKDLKDRINEIKGTQECPKCGKIVERLAEFCPKCGCRLSGGPQTADGAAPPHPAAVPADTAPPAADTAPPAAERYEKHPPEAEDTYGGTPEVSGGLRPSAPSGSPAPAAGAPITAPIPSAPEPANAAPPPKRICGVCHTANEPGTKFCLSCGRIL
jgi:ribosomal protein L37AE/L43A